MPTFVGYSIDIDKKKGPAMTKERCLVMTSIGVVIHSTYSRIKSLLTPNLNKKIHAVSFKLLQMSFGIALKLISRAPAPLKTILEFH